MAKFKYRMQSILNVKMKLEVQAKQEFASAQAALSREEEKLNRLAARKNQSTVVLRHFHDEPRSILVKVVHLHPA